MAWHFEEGRLHKDAEFLHKVAFFNSKRCLVRPGEELGILWD